MKIACFTPVKSRQLFLRTCLLQIKAQTRRPDIHFLLINGEGSEAYDTRTIADLTDEKIRTKVFPQDSNTAELSILCLEELLKEDIDVFFKIDSDDIYYTNYVETILNQLVKDELEQREEGFCINLIDQLIIFMLSPVDVRIDEANFHEGLGLSAAEKEKGMQVGAPPTFVFDRKIAKLLIRCSGEQQYAHIVSDDQLFRTILIDHGIVIERNSTPEPIFAYLVHGSNTASYSFS